MISLMDRVNSVCDRIDVEVTAKLINDTEKVFETKITEMGGFRNTTYKVRRLAWQTAQDEVSNRLIYRVWRAIW